MTWEEQHDLMSKRIDVDTRALDRIARSYTPQYNAVVDDYYSMFAVDGNIIMDDVIKPLTIAERSKLNMQMTTWINSGDYVKDKQFITALKRMLYTPIIRRSDYLELNLRAVSSQLKTSQSPRIVSSLYNTWLDSEKTVARLTNSTFTNAGDDLIYKTIYEKWDGNSLIPRLYSQAVEIVSQFMGAMKRGINAGLEQSGINKLVDRMFKDGDHRSRRILVSESARINTEAKVDSFIKADVKYFKFLAVRDSVTTDVCVKHDNKVYRVDNLAMGVNAPPLHINCRSTISAYFIDYRDGGGSEYP